MKYIFDTEGRDEKGQPIVSVEREYSRNELQNLISELWSLNSRMKEKIRTLLHRHAHFDTRWKGLAPRGQRKPAKLIDVSKENYTALADDLIRLKNDPTWDPDYDESVDICLQRIIDIMLEENRADMIEAIRRIFKEKQNTASCKGEWNKCEQYVEITSGLRSRITAEREQDDLIVLHTAQVYEGSSQAFNIRRSDFSNKEAEVVYEFFKTLLGR